jgi:histidinol-phosphate/aromatic aminotransferase/cobyric acid decarboxylase-like protein
VDPASVLDLSASLNPFAPDAGPVVAAVIARGALGRYPDDDDRRIATAAMAAALGVHPGRVLLTNGGAEAIALVAAELRRGRVDDPDFSLYARHLESLSPEAPRWRSDPHNPTGVLAGDAEAAAVWDEAFYPLATGRWTRHPGPVPRAAPAVVLGSLTKVLACPGLRLGYVVVPDDDGSALGVPGLADRLAARQARWAVGTPALMALPVLLETADLPRWCAAVAEHRRQLVDLLVANGLSPRPSDANFVLCDGADGVRDQLARHGVVVRDGASFGLAGCVRIAVPDGAGLDRLAAALRAARVPATAR